MKLEIDDPKHILDRDFISWLIIRIRNTLIEKIDDTKLIKWNEYFSDNPVYKSIYKKQIDTRDIIIAGASNLDFTQSEEGFSISVNRNIWTPGLDRIKLDSVCKLINFGNIENKGYSIFTDTFDYFAENILDYVDMYLSRML